MKSVRCRRPKAKIVVFRRVPRGAASKRTVASQENRLKSTLEHSKGRRRMNTVEIGPITEAHIESFTKLDVRRPPSGDIWPLPRSAAAGIDPGFMLEPISGRANPQFCRDGRGRSRTLRGGRLVRRDPRNRGRIYALCGGVGLRHWAFLPRFRSQGLGRRLITRTLQAARACGLTRVNCRCGRTTGMRSRCTRGWGL